MQRISPAQRAVQLLQLPTCAFSFSAAAAAAALADADPESESEWTKHRTSGASECAGDGVRRVGVDAEEEEVTGKRASCTQTRYHLMSEMARARIIHQKQASP